MIPVFRPTIRRADMDAVLTRLASDSIGPGDISREFSTTLARHLGRRSGVAGRSLARVCRAAVASLQLEPGSRIGVSILAPRSVHAAIEAEGHTAVAIDVQKRVPVLPSPLDRDYQELRLDALVVDTRLGYIADLDNFRDLGIPIIEEITDGFGGNIETTIVGGIGELVVVGLEPDAIITTAGGAAVLTNNTRRVATLTSYVDPDTGEPPLPDMNAALGLTQLKQLDRFLERRREIAARLIRALQRGAHTVVLQGESVDLVFPALPVKIESSPRDVEKYARSHGVATTRAFGGSGLSHLDADEAEAREFPNAIGHLSRIVLFPLFPTLSSADQEQIERVLATLP
jgi:dTDP-4-amino-4,6-dideoxygalactose transaminase